MRHTIATRVFAGALAPVESLDVLMDRLEAEGGQIPFQLIDPGPRPDEHAECQETVSAILAFTESLSERERDIFHRVFLEKDTQTAVASELGVSKMAISKAVARILTRARAVPVLSEFLALGSERGFAAARAPAAKRKGLSHGGANRCRKV